eukprot:5278509-Pyramimonas_sp.AAC.1
MAFRRRGSTWWTSRRASPKAFPTGWARPCRRATHCCGRPTASRRLVSRRSGALGRAAGSARWQPA